MVEQIYTDTPGILGVKLSGKLNDYDYRRFVPIVEGAVVSQGRIRMLTVLEDFHGWDLHALWDDIKFATKHGSDFERIALVGDRKWEQYMASVCKPFTKAAVKYFDAREIDAAWEWVREAA